MNAVPSQLSAGIGMCVYNGARFLREQLESIAAQDVHPQRVVVLDDCSTDGSWEILRTWATTAPFPVHLQRNEVQVGVVRNFEKACSLLETDLIFLCDQDDVWYPEKIRTFVEAFVEDPHLILLHGNADLIDQNGETLGLRLFDALLISPEERQTVAEGRAWKVYAKRNLVTGAACAFRRELLDVARPFSNLWIHDEWLAFHAALRGRVRMLQEVAMAYRLHGANSVGLPLPTLRWRLRTVFEALIKPTKPRQLERANRLDEMAEAAGRLQAPPTAVEYLKLAADHARFRATLPRNPISRFLKIQKERKAGNYHAWSGGRVSMLHDLLIAR